MHYFVQNSSSRVPSFSRVLRLWVFCCFSVIGFSAQAGVVQLNVNTLFDVDSSFDNRCSLREAIHTSNTGNRSGLLNLFGECPAVPEGDTAQINLGAGLHLLLSNLPEITWNVLITGQGQNTVIDGAETYRVFEVGRYQLTLTAMTIRRAKSAALTIGGGTATLIGVDFVNNYSVDPGGAIYINRGSLTMTFVNFIGNSTTSVIGGGALYVANHAVVTINKSTFSGNSAGSGRGGAIRTRTGAVTNVTISLSTLSGNEAARGGGVYMGDLSVVSLDSVTMTKNVSGGEVEGITQGDGIFGEDATLNLSNSVIAGNAIVDILDNGLLEINSTAGNLVGAVYPGLMEFSDGVQSRNGDSDFVGSVPAHGQPIDPKLGLLQDNGGGSLTHLPKANSPLIDSGHCLVAVGTTDQRLKKNETLNIRLYDHPSIVPPAGQFLGCDIGAVEVYKDELPDDSFCFPIKAANGKVVLICL